jgi:hypothetical protein
MMDFNDAPNQAPEQDGAFNDAPKQAPEQDGDYGYDIEEISRRLAEKAPKWVRNWFPNGVINKRGDELRLANIRGAPPRNEGSCVIYLKGDKAGRWYDFTEGTGGPPLSTLAEATGRRGADLLGYAAGLAGVSRRPSVERLWIMANAVGTNGDLRRFVPKKPRWCALYGDDMVDALRTRSLNSQEIERLTKLVSAALNTLKAVESTPVPDRALLFERVVPWQGESYWDWTYLAVADVQKHFPKTVGLA